MDKALGESHDTALPTFIFNSVDEVDFMNDSLESGDVVDVCAMPMGTFALAQPMQDGQVSEYDLYAEVSNRMAQKGKPLTSVAMVIATLQDGMRGPPLFSFIYKK